MQLVDSIIYNNIEYKIDDYIHYIKETKDYTFNVKGKILYIDKESESVLVITKFNSKEYDYELVFLNEVYKKLPNLHYTFKEKKNEHIGLFQLLIDESKKI